MQLASWRKQACRCLQEAKKKKVSAESRAVDVPYGAIGEVAATILKIHPDGTTTGQARVLL